MVNDDSNFQYFSYVCLSGKQANLKAIVSICYGSNIGVYVNCLNCQSENVSLINCKFV